MNVDVNVFLACLIATYTLVLFATSGITAVGLLAFADTPFLSAWVFLLAVAALVVHAAVRRHDTIDRSRTVTRALLLTLVVVTIVFFGWAIGYTATVCKLSNGWALLSVGVYLQVVFRLGFGFWPTPKRLKQGKRV